MTSSIRFFHWLPRIAAILAILFVSLFAADAFEAGVPFWKQLDAFLIHLVPSIILSLILLLAWRKEYIGGIIFLLIGLFMTPVIFTHNYEVNKSFWTSLLIILYITAPFILIGLLFIFSHFLKKRKGTIS